MARVQGHYNYYEINNEGFSDEPQQLCFICAVKKAVLANPKKSKIYFMTSEQEYPWCSECEEYIEDTIEI